MFCDQSGGSHPSGPGFGKAGSCEGAGAPVISQVVGHGGLKTVVSAAKGGANPLGFAMAAMISYHRLINLGIVGGILSAVARPADA